MEGGKPASVAVIIPTYNHAHFLSPAIDSVLGQTLRAAEILVVDDGSSDHPERITDRYPEVRIVHQANAGLAAARNTGLRETSAPLLLFLDADDRLRARAIETGLASLAKDESAAFTYGAYAIVRSELGEVFEVPFEPVPKDAFADFLRMNPIGMHGTVIYRRPAIAAARGFREHLRACEDYDLYLRLARDYPVLCHADICADYYHHGSNMSGDPVFMLRTAVAVLKDYRLDAKKRGLLADYEAGVAAWKEHYVGVWAGMARRSPRTGLAKAPGLAALAPGQMLRKSARVLADRLR